MNYKLLFPTYRNRYLFIKENLAEFGKKTFPNALNLGMGEGDYDPMIVKNCGKLIGCDINENDVNFARTLNEGTPNLTYQVDNALDLSFNNNSFDLIVSVDVMEHVGKPERMTEEIARVLKPGGVAFVTFPQIHFPVTYDPINRFLSYFSKAKISQGAYAFGHEYLVDGDEFKKWAEKYGMTVVKEKNLSGYFVALLEMYWTGIIQSIFKENSGNISGEKEKTMKLRPSLSEPFLAKIFTDIIIKIDYFLFKNTKHSVGKGFVVRKK
jgi:ubiquinone/menaquinone biosynthesis C-methylase UbiE